MASGWREARRVSLLSSQLGSLVTSEGYLISFSLEEDLVGFFPSLLCLTPSSLEQPPMEMPL